MFEKILNFFKKKMIIEEETVIDDDQLYIINRKYIRNDGKLVKLLNVNEQTNICKIEGINKNNKNYYYSVTLKNLLKNYTIQQ